MLCIFDEAASCEGSLHLLGDGAISLFRQWVLGCGAWKVLAAASVAAMQLLFFSQLAIIRGGPANRPPSMPYHYYDFEFSRALLLVFVLLVGLIGFLGVLRARTASRH
jgi:hypothetical protein